MTNLKAKLKKARAKAPTTIVSQRAAGPDLKIVIEDATPPTKWGPSVVVSYYVDGRRIPGDVYSRIVQTLQLGASERVGNKL